MIAYYIFLILAVFLIGAYFIATAADAAPTETDLYKLDNGLWSNEIDYYIMNLEHSLNKVKYI